MVAGYSLPMRNRPPLSIISRPLDLEVALAPLTILPDGINLPEPLGINLGVASGIEITLSDDLMEN